MLTLVLTIFFIGITAIGGIGQKSYKGFSVLRTHNLQASEALLLKQLEESYDFWKEARPNTAADIMATGQSMETLKKFLRQHNISYSIMVEDVQDLMNESMHESSIRNFLNQTKTLDWTDYYNHDKINAWMDSLAEEYDFINTVSIGKSYEGRDMRVIQIQKAGKDAPNVFIEAGIHAREWIAPAMATYLINELLQVHKDSEEKKRDNLIDFIKHLNVHVLPSANPDGYEYSITEDRLWRKTRSKTDSPIGCRGVDGNRNFDFHFGESGVSSAMCSQTYNGPEPFSEVETRNIRDYVLQLSPIPILAHCLHSYSQLWMYPYGHTTGVYPDNADEIVELGKEAVRALKEVHNTEFSLINIADLYAASGSSADWYKGVLSARFVYGTELRDTGNYGFILPPNQIIPSGEELWAAFKVVFAKLIELS